MITVRMIMTLVMMLMMMKEISSAEKIYDDASKKEFGDLDWTSMFNFIKNK